MAGTEAQTPQQQSAFPFLKLPAKLRLKIYELLIRGLTIHVGCPIPHVNDMCDDWPTDIEMADIQREDDETDDDEPKEKGRNGIDEDESEEDEMADYENSEDDDSRVRICQAPFTDAHFATGRRHELIPKL